MSETGAGKRILAIIPAYNESATVANVVREVRQALPGAEVVVVNDASTDDTAERAHHAGAVVLTLPLNLGIGGAVQTGFRYADRHGFDIAIQVDGDGQHTPAEIPRLLEEMERENADIVIGSRFLGRGDYTSTAARWLGNRFFALFLSTVLRRRITDPTSGFRASSRRVIELFSKDYPQDYPEGEAHVIAKKAGFVVREVPVAMRERTAGQSSITTLLSPYYTAKVALAIFVGLMRRKPERT